MVERRGQTPTGTSRVAAASQPRRSLPLGERAWSGFRVAAAAGSRQLRMVCGSRVWRVVFLALLTAMAIIVPLQLGFGWYVPPL